MHRRARLLDLRAVLSLRSITIVTSQPERRRVVPSEEPAAREPPITIARAACQFQVVEGETFEATMRPLIAWRQAGA